MARIHRARLRSLHVWAVVRDWCLRWVFAQHNARVIIDFERRMMSIIEAATGGVMSKAYYTVDAMLIAIAEAQATAREDAYAEGRDDAREEFGGDLRRPIEVIVFKNEAHARSAGFKGALHGADPFLRAWWPGLGAAGLMSRPIGRVTMSAAARGINTSEGSLVNILRSRQQCMGPNAIWIELE